MNSITMVNIIFVISVKKFTLIGLNLNFPSTFEMYTNIGYKKNEVEQCQVILKKKVNIANRK
jgi:hypothetical protein